MFIPGFTIKKLITASIVSLVFSLSCFASPVQTNQVQKKQIQTKQVDPTTGITTWTTKSHGVNFSLTHILPDQLRAFYVNRGFTLEQAESFATSCVYMTVMRNDKAAGTIHFIKKNWSVIANQKPHTLVSVDRWMQMLKKEKVKKSALLAFQFAQFPPEQEFEPGGDWNQGMLSIGLSPGSFFDLIVRWDIDGKSYETPLEKVQCAK